MRSTQVVVAGVSASQWIPLDPHISPFNVGFSVAVTKPGGTDITYSVQHTFNDVLAGSAATVFDNPFVSGQTTNQDGNYAFPVKAVRLSVTAVSGAGTSAELTVIQAGLRA